MSPSLWEHASKIEFLQVTWSNSAHLLGVTGVRMLNSYALGCLGNLTMVSLVPSMVCPTGRHRLTGQLEGLLAWGPDILKQ